MNKKVLFIIDAQYGFINGSLAVENAKETMDNLAKYIIENGKSYDKIFLTVDWHPTTHCSFVDNGGEWPPHCIQFTHDAAVYQPIMDALSIIKADYTVLTKGLDENHEEYSVFKNEKSCGEILNVCSNLRPNNIDFVGIAFDYCVKESAIGAKKMLDWANIHVLREFCPSIGEGNDTVSVLDNNGINVI